MLVCVLFQGVKYLSAGAECTITGVDDIVEVEEVQEDDLDERCVVKKGEIDGVLYTKEQAGCMACMVTVQSEFGRVHKVWDDYEVNKVQQVPHCEGVCQWQSANVPTVSTIDGGEVCFDVDKGVWFTL